MAASRVKTAPVGSAQWVQSEKEQASQFVEQEVEEFGYSVRNEMEWLNEHMADIFSKSAVNFADVFKTPGKLRGKTPRTARKREALEQRQPLTDIFAPNTQNQPALAKSTAFYDKVTQFKIAEDGENLGQQQRPIRRSRSPQRMGKPGNTDSGYHGMTEDEMDMETQTDRDVVPSQSLEVHAVPMRENQGALQRVNVDEFGVTSDESFVSAKEDTSTRKGSKEQLPDEQDSDNATVPDEDMIDEKQELVIQETQPEEPVEDIEVEAEQDLEAELSHPPSENSSPEKPLQRKSSFTFSSLPAREPLTGKRSIGGRNSQMDAYNRNSVLARSLGKSFGAPQVEDSELQDRPEEVKAHGKTSTQLLHERITMLGKTKEPRPSKSIPPAALYPQLPGNEEEELEESAPEATMKDEPHSAAPLDDEDDDWIAPTKTAPSRAAAQPAASAQASPARPAMHYKSNSTTQLPSPSRNGMAPPLQRHQTAMSVSHPGQILEDESTTPAGSPMHKKHPEAHMSASKKLWTAFKSARSLFASSAGSSAAAKLEANATSPVLHRTRQEDISDQSRPVTADMPATADMRGLLNSTFQFPASPSRPLSGLSTSPSRKTRSSTESNKKREKETKAQRKAADELEKAREKERQKTAKAQEDVARAERAEQARREQQEQEAADAAAAAAEAEAAAAMQRPTSAESDRDREDMPPPPPPKSMLPAGKLRAPGRLVRPTRDNASAKGKPAPVNIRVTAQSQRMQQGPSQSSFSQSQYESAAPPPPPKTGLRTNSSQSNSRTSTMPASRVKALEAAARKKEQEEREKQRKAEQKRELERKRAAKAEEERRVEQERKAEEQRKLQESKLAAQRQAEKQAAEARRREQQRLERERLEQQRQQEASQKARAAHELAESIQRERAQQQAMPRGDVGGTLRQLGQKMVPDLAGRIIQPNPAKPPKRNYQNDDEESAHQQPQRLGMQRNPPSYQSNDAKRRKTEEGEEIEQRHSVMAPPKRPSAMRKETLTKFPHAFTHAPPPAPHHSSSIFKSTVTAQHQMQHPSHPNQTIQHSSARIPFAEPSNTASSSYGYTQQPPTQQSKFKTPARPAQVPKPAKSSPLYPAGDSIALPEIMTDSEDEESDSEDQPTGFRAPSWVASPALRDLLTQQQLVDPETVFGPIGELKMDEVFKGAKNQDRLKRFRERGSSARWVETGDAVTSAEKRRDLEGRERLVREGGWRYDPKN